MKLEWKITTMSLIYFTKFELTASGGVEICCLFGTYMVPSGYLRCRCVLHVLISVIATDNPVYGGELQLVLPVIGILVRFAHHS